MRPNIIEPQSEVGQQLTADEYENSFPLDQGRRFAQQSGRDLADRVQLSVAPVAKRVRARKAYDEQRFRVTLETLLANIVAAHRNVVDPDRFVSVSLSKAYYNGSELSYKAMKDCCEQLQAANLVEFGPGFRRPDIVGDGHFGRQSRIRAAAPLRELIDRADLGRRPLSRPASQLIRINARLEGVGEASEEVEASRSTIEAVNRQLANADLAVRPEVIAALKAAHIENEGEDEGARSRRRQYAGDLTATSIYRAFKYDWNQGGRFYGGWWMSFPSALRAYITINGDPVVELDYKTLHPLLLYRRAGLDLDFDPYQVPPWNGQAMRELGKRTFNRLLNRAESDSAKRLRIRAAAGDCEVLPKGVTFAAYRDELVNQLWGIERWFGSGEGTRLQYADSELALSVMAAMEAEAIPVLPIHDSFIVPAQHERALSLAMLDAFLTKYGDIPLISRKAPLAAYPAVPPGHNWVA